MTKVLFVEDNRNIHAGWKRDLEELGGKVEVLSAYSVTEAEAVFTANPDIALIVVDACVPGDKPTTLPLVIKLRNHFSFSGPIIAASSFNEYRQDLMGVGCDYECEKFYVPKKIHEVLGI